VNGIFRAAARVIAVNGGYIVATALVHGTLLLSVTRDQVRPAGSLSLARVGASAGALGAVDGSGMSGLPAA
jgi:hypothetical protein